MPWRWWRRSGPIARVAINMRPTSAPWGGGNQWLAQMRRYLAGRGYEVVFRLVDDLDAIVLVDPRVEGRVTFGADDIRRYKETRTGVVCVHRVNECDARKGTTTMDAQLARANPVADFTVFVSAWLRDHHAARWFDTTRPHAVIDNGADPALFHAVGAETFSTPGPLRLVTHHWSDNAMKGFDVYREVDALIASGKLPDTELVVIGRWPADIRWQAARTYPPTRGAALGTLLRRCHLYLTASRFEPGPMHAIEGAQCGLPLVYHEDGGGLVELARRYGIGFRGDVRSAILEARERYAELRARVLAEAPSGDQMCVDYGRVLHRLLAERRSG